MSDKIFNPIDYPNKLSLIKFTSSDIRSIIKNYKIPTFGIYIDEVENDRNLPMFVRLFYEYIIRYNTIPASDEFYNYYCDINSLLLKQNHYGVYKLLGLKGRMYRLYPSLVRELEFIKYVSENISFEYDVIYNFNLDIFEGVDIIIVDIDNNYYGVNLFVSTSRSKDYKKEKPDRHQNFDNIKYIDHPIDLRGDNLKMGNFELYSENSFKNLLNKLIYED